MPSIRRQRGIGLTGLSLYLVFGSFLLIIAAKLGPQYLRYLTIRSVMQDLTEDPALSRADEKTIADAIANRLYINDVRALDANAFQYKRAFGGGYRVILDYRVQEHLFSNIDVVLTFNHEVTLGKQ